MQIGLNEMPLGWARLLIKTCNPRPFQHAEFTIWKKILQFSSKCCKHRQFVADTNLKSMGFCIVSSDSEFYSISHTEQEIRRRLSWWRKENTYRRWPNSGIDTYQLQTTIQKSSAFVQLNTRKQAVGKY
jgi:hypothetical protein